MYVYKYLDIKKCVFITGGGAEWNGVEWSGAEWNGVDWNEADWESVFGSLFGAPPSPAWSPAWRWIIRRECGSLLYILYTVYAQYNYIWTLVWRETVQHPVTSNLPNLH